MTTRPRMAALYSACAAVAIALLAGLSSCSHSDSTPSGPPDDASIALTLAPGTVSLAPGGNSTVAVAIARTNFTGAVTLTATGAPTGVTVNFDAATTTTGSANATVAVAASAAPGTSTITITASGTGVTSASATIALTVTGTAISFNYCRNVPIWFGVQEGNGAWRQIVPTSPGVFSFTFGAQTGAIATVAQGTGTADSYGLSIQYETVDQMREVSQALCDYTGAKAVTVNVIKAASDRIDIGFGPAYFIGTTSRTNYPFTTVPDGPIDLIASRSTGTAASNRVVIRRGLNVTTGTTLPNIDFTTTTEGFVPETRNVSVSGLQGGDFLTMSSYYSPNAITGIASPIGLSTTLTPTTFTVSALPASQIVAGDMHEIYATGIALDGSNYAAAKLMHNPQDATLTLPAPLAIPSLTFAATTPYPRPHLTLARQTDYNSDLFFFGTQSSAGVFSRQLLVDFSGAYMGSAPTDYTLPDLSGVAGFSAAWGLKTGAVFSYQVSASGWTMAPNSVVTKNWWLDGQTARYGVRTGTITP